MEKRFSKVNIRGSGISRHVEISSRLKPEITDKIIKKWQYLLDLTARIINIPSCLIMRLNETDIEVFLGKQHTRKPI